MRGGVSKKGFIYKNNILNLNYENKEKEVLPQMQRTIAVIYEKGVFKPLEKVELKEGEKMEIRLEEKKSPLEESFGIWAEEKGGIEYVNEIRDEAEKRLMEKGID
jgi:predicted DNA-binding antitoxin AbrB/MazE fold protein